MGIWRGYVCVYADLYGVVAPEINNKRYQRRFLQVIHSLEISGTPAVSKAALHVFFLY
jgi:hypothetical protein